MDEEEVRQAFAARVHELCDELGIPQGHGRQTLLGKRFGVTPKAARKWLNGIAYPEMATAVRMCEEAGLNVLWLLQGTGPKRAQREEASLVTLAEGLQRLPELQRSAVLEFLRYQFVQADGWFTNEALQRYTDSIDALQRQTANSRALPLRT